jgi:hypothetical protein
LPVGHGRLAESDAHLKADRVRVFDSGQHRVDPFGWLRRPEHDADPDTLGGQRCHPGAGIELAGDSERAFIM